MDEKVGPVQLVRVTYKDANDRISDPPWETAPYEVFKAKLVACQLKNMGCYGVKLRGVGHPPEEKA